MQGWRNRRTTIGAAAFLGMTVSSPAILSINPLLLTPMVDDFDWGRATISAAYLVSAPVMAVLYLVVGPALDRYGVRRLLVPGYLLFGICTILLSQLNGSVVQLLVLKMMVASFATIPTGVAFGKVISAHFTKRRGTMLGLCLGGGGGFGMMIVPLVGAAVLEASGWRMAYVAIGIIAIAVGLLATTLLPADSPARANSDKDNSASKGEAEAIPHGIDGREARKSRTFLLLAGATLLSCMVLNGMLAHLSAIMTDSGMSTAEAAFALSIYAGAMICGQFGIGLILDKVETPRIFIVVLCVVLAGLALLYSPTASWMGLLGAACIGAGAGSEYGLLPYVITRYFGLRSFGQLYGYIYAAASCGTALGPYAMGLAFDISGHYGQAIMAFGAALLVVITIVSRLPHYAFATDGAPLAGPKDKAMRADGVAATS